MTALDDSRARDLQSKPWRAFLRDNPGIAPSVEAYLSGGARPSTSSLEPNHYAVARVLAEDARRAGAVLPDDYTYRVATFNRQTDKIIGCLNANPPKGSWWDTAQPRPPARWADGGGLEEIAVDGKPGLRMVVTPDMLYPPGIEDSIEVSYHTYPKDLSGAIRGQVWDWLWSQRAPSGPANPSGWANDWNVGEGYCLATSTPSGNMVGNHLYLDYGSPLMGFRFGRTTGFNTWQFYPCPIKFPPDTLVEHRIRARYTESQDGFIQVWTTPPGGSPVKWVDYAGPTLPQGWDVWKVMETLRCPKGRHQTMEWVNSRVTIDKAPVAMRVRSFFAAAPRAPEEPHYLPSPPEPEYQGWRIA